MQELCHKGVYNSKTPYKVGDTVYYETDYQLNTIYICIQNSLGNIPTNTTYWVNMKCYNTAILLHYDKYDNLECLYINGKKVEFGYNLGGNYKIKYFIILSKKYNFKLEELKELTLIFEDAVMVKDSGFPENIKDFTCDYELNNIKIDGKYNNYTYRDKNGNLYKAKLVY